MSETEGQFAHDQAAVARGLSLVSLVEPHLPIQVEVDSNADWRLLGPALIARMAGAQEAIIALEPLRREADAIVVLRSLYDHSATFAWLAADPSKERLRRWLKSDLVARLKADDDCRSLGVEILSDETRRQFERDLAELPAVMPSLADRALAADSHWGERIFPFESEGLRSFRGLYAFAYRRHSSIAHASNLGIQAVWTETGHNKVKVDFEGYRTDYFGPFGLATTIFAFGLFVAAETLGWPEAPAISQAFNEHPPPGSH